MGILSEFQALALGEDGLSEESQVLLLPGAEAIAERGAAQAAPLSSFRERLCSRAQDFVA